MKFTANLSAFQSTLQKAMPAIPRKSTLPVLEHLHFTLKGEELSIVATDQDITIKTTLKVVGSADGSILVPGRRISEIIKALNQSGDITFSTNEDTFEIKLQTASGKYDMKGLDHNEYLNTPELFESSKPDVDITGDKVTFLSPDSKTAFFGKKDLSYISNKTVFAVSSDEFRPAMNGVLFQFRENYVNAVATDSFRLAKAVLRSETKRFPDDLDVIIPARSMEVLKKADEDVLMSVIETRGKQTHARFDFGDTVFITRLIDEKFPPYETVIPLSSNFKALVSQKELVSCIKRVSIFTSDVSHQIRVKFEPNQIIIIGEDEDTGAHADETLDCEYTGKSFEIAFNYKYLEQALDNLDGETEGNRVMVLFTEPAKPVIVRPERDNEDLLMLIMPVRIH
jgi:DNA polymerase-3 subunit beta